MKVSFVVPCYNEEKEVEQFYNKLMSVVKNIDIDYELIFVDDGSKDENSKKT